MANGAVLIRGLDRSLYNSMVAKAKEHGRNVADVVNEAMRAYLKESTPPNANVFETKKLSFSAILTLSKKDILGFHEELGQPIILENSGKLTLDKDIDKETFHKIMRIHNTGKLRVPSDVHHLALLKAGHVQGEVEKY